MAELIWTAVSPLSHSLGPGRHGADAGSPGVTLAALRDFELVQVMARRGQWQVAAAAAEALYDAPPPSQPQAISAKGARLIWSGPDQFFVLAPRGGEGIFAPAASTGLAAARTAFAGKVSLSDQSDGRLLLRLCGPKVRDTLAKICSLDLHPAAFPPGAAAVTSIDHTSVNLWRGADEAGQGPAFYLLVFSTFAESLAKTILDSAAEYGVEIGPAAAFAG